MSSPLAGIRLSLLPYNATRKQCVRLSRKECWDRLDDMELNSYYSLCIPFTDMVHCCSAYPSVSVKTCTTQKLPFSKRSRVHRLFSFKNEQNQSLQLGYKEFTNKEIAHFKKINPVITWVLKILWIHSVKPTVQHSIFQKPHEPEP